MFLCLTFLEAMQHPLIIVLGLNFIIILKVTKPDEETTVSAPTIHLIIITTAS
jgi:hypothetical protein